MAHSVGSLEQASYQKLLDEVEAMDFKTLSVFLSKVKSIKLRRSQPQLPDREVELIALLQEGGPGATALEKQEQLSRKVKNGTISREELAELDQLLHQFAEWDVERVQLLIELADLQKISVPEVVDKYQLYTPGQLMAKGISHG